MSGDLIMGGDPPRRDDDPSGARSMDPMASALDGRVVRLDPRRDAIDRWSAALVRGDDDEVDRLVQQSRSGRTVVASGKLGATESRDEPTASS
jgi:hypothetical protein